ncbi:MAG: hypothetical protein J0647_07000 [Campylobacteraceae bacterium]|nr:hypothetical protein [Campylobacteraceae bacterium]
MSKGFIEKIIGNSIETEILENAKNFRKLWESTNIEAFGQNEFFGGKA